MKQGCQVQWFTIDFQVKHYYTRFCCIRYTARMNSAYFRISKLSTHANHVCVYITPNSTYMTHRVEIYQGTDALYRELKRITVSDSKTECISHHVSRNNIRNSETRLTGTMIYDTFPCKTLLNTVLLHSMQCKDEFRIFQYINFVHAY